MALTVSSRYIFPPNYSGTPPTVGGFKRVAIHLTGIGIATEEEAKVVKIDLSTLKNTKGVAPVNVVIEKIEYDISGFNNVLLEGDHTSDTTIAVLSGRGKIEEDIVDDGSGGTGDVLLSTSGGVAGSSYDITIVARLR